MKKRAKQRTPGKSAKFLYLPLLCLLASGCSYYGGQFSCFDLTDDNKKTLANRKAAEKFWSSVRPKSNLSDAHYRLGLHYQQMGEYDKAIGEFNKALRNDRNYCKAFNGIAMTHDVRKSCEEAHAAYEQAVICAPGEAYVYNNYACSSLLCGNYGKGMELLQKAEGLAKSDTRIKNNLKIAQTIAIRENFSGFLGENQPQPATTDDASFLPANEQALLDPAPTTTDNMRPEASSRDIVSETSAIDPAAAPVEIAIASAAPEISPIPPQPAEAGNPSTEDLATMSSPAIPPSPPIKVAIEVSNGNGITGMAKRSADFLRGHGFTVRSITNAKHFQFEESVIYYKEEHLQAAKDLAAVIPGSQNLEKVDSLSKSSVGVKVLLGRDLSDVRFPEGYAGLADYRQTGRLQPAVLTASNNQVDY